ncbi:hypothetical protein CAEBREN_24050 [Caenorhabditis brenneri]|uniref:Uncharacterized protein n=1 Tax=Caenorhabditis brenneri TaxID=135651 RepID=G0MUW1_CAEBE|nr:hypothetical protein CAEBREN_24050 [Caenorhabditis brenneri]
MCEEKIPVKEPCKFRIIDSDMDMVNIITNPKKPVLIIHYKMENWENATKYFDLVAFQAKYTEFEVYFKASTSPEPTWSFSIHDRVPSLFSTPRSCQENNFVWNLERAIDRFLEARKKWFS